MTTPLSPTSALNAVRRHSEYYFKGGDLYFLFKDELSVSASAGELPKGSKESAIQIDKATAEEFASFLWTYYNRKFDDYSKATVETWTAILKVASEYDFPSVKDFAVRGLETKSDLDLADRIALYCKYKVNKKYIVPLFLRMIQREEWLSNDEIGIIGGDATTLISRGRERFLKLTNGGTAGVNDDNAKKALQAIPGALAIVNPGAPSTSPGDDEKRKNKANSTGDATNNLNLQKATNDASTLNGVANQKHGHKGGQ